MQHQHDHHHTSDAHSTRMTGHGPPPSAGNPPMGHSGHDHHRMMIDDFRKRFLFTLVLTIPVMALSPMIQHWVGISWTFSGASYVLLFLSSSVFIYGGFPFLKGLVQELRMRNPGMMTLIGLAITVAYIYSLAIVLGLEGMDFFWELCTLILIMLLGHWIEMKSVAGASRELELLVEMMPSTAYLVEGENAREVSTASLQHGDVILIKPGEKVAADGLVLEGESYLNESMLTGESVPVKKGKGEKVISGALNGQGALKVKVTHAASDSYLSKVIGLVQTAQKSKSKTQLLANKAARWLTFLALGAGAITFLYWWQAGTHSLSFALERMVTVMVICCPHALGLAVPLVVAKSTSVSARHGLLIKNRTAFENARRITTLIFDKTGTLTQGTFEVSAIHSVSALYSTRQILSLAASLEQQSEHPIATGIMKEAKEKDIPVLPIEAFSSITGKGIEAIVEGQHIMVVSPGYLEEHQLALPEGFDPTPAETVVFILVDHALAGYISLSDRIRPESAGAIRTLHRHGIKSQLLTGDHARVAAHVSQTLKMDAYLAEALPHQKLEKIKALQEQGEFVAMTGDGVNDAPALAQADVGIAVGSGSDIAAETADIILVNSNPNDIVNLIRFGKATYRKMLQNLVWATGYNIIALPLAAGVLYRQGILLSPAAGAILMSLSTVVVAINARLLRMPSSHIHGIDSAAE